MYFNMHLFLFKRREKGAQKEKLKKYKKEAMSR
jgi:hypothetical protein